MNLVCETQVPMLWIRSKDNDIIPIFIYQKKKGQLNNILDYIVVQHKRQ